MEETEKKPIKTENSNFGATILVGMIVSSFIMLSLLTWAAKPIERIVENVNKKAEMKAKLNACIALRNQTSDYERWMSRLYASGCMYNIRTNLMQSVKTEEEKEHIKSIFKDGTSAYDEAINYCISGATSAIREHQIVDEMVQPLINEVLKCNQVLEMAEKEGIRAQ